MEDKNNGLCKTDKSVTGYLSLVIKWRVLDLSMSHMLIN